MQKSNTKVVVGKWKDKRDVLFLTTQAIPEMVKVPTRRDQKAAYSSPERRRVKWYRKIVVELLTNTVLVNALVVFKEVTGKNMSVTEFHENIVCALLNNKSKNSIQVQHILEERQTRGRCSTY
ncbi:uncharacterized protein LOC126739809 [Anthonomus grandis grandis]|uniref:uncharacterized protein LOC126739809 n=1 Tax=Anthonomus grandis grandis TaxID=2921223 RepID=UPI0021667980|nr:uncharacterized protein LOC126739809 [Anthonomus grandis grandis]